MYKCGKCGSEFSNLASFRDHLISCSSYEKIANKVMEAARQRCYRSKLNKRKITT